MKSLFIGILVLMFVGMGISQTIKVKKADWDFVTQTAVELDSALTECQTLDSLNTLRITEFNGQVKALILANHFADSIISKKNQQLKFRREQVGILNDSLRKKRFEIWMYRAGGSVIIIAGVFLLIR